MTIEDRIEAAEGLFMRRGASCIADERVRVLLSAYREALEETARIFARNRIGAFCSACAARVPGGCCFQEIEDTYDLVQLLANRLLGAPLPRTRLYAGQCIFLGPRGCTLLARDPFCVNYFCPEIKAGLGPATMKEIRTVVGRELTAGWELEQALRLRLPEVQPVRSPAFPAPAGKAPLRDFT
ncbi:MAG: hypothetical protein SWC40_01605 [Thermodesulfobacteriota bacterium]|nr:hypothetical protein [Thermodesulfobacteriota bacterium]